ncbi:hypothetical protein DC429_18915 [Arthrobacter sp. TPD3018]|jgi:hypothetical protein|nr:hypothetical protein DC429_18915 [Arthrobacter sp. TPD3018]PVE49807.1 hypothetical protein DC425_18860 [Sphingomonas sp. TPD3009]PVE79507.1 hypothetical protein DC431_17640 [Sphingomonas melonis]
MCRPSLEITMPIQTLHQSLSFDTIIKDHPDRASAEAHMAKTLREYGDWPADAAAAAARDGRTVLVIDNGDDETIAIRVT